MSVITKFQNHVNFRLVSGKIGHPVTSNAAEVFKKEKEF